MAIEEYRAPASLADALTCLRGGDYTVLAGGTDLMPQVHAGRVKFGRGLLHRLDRVRASQISTYALSVFGKSFRHWSLLLHAHRLIAARAPWQAPVLSH